MATTTDEPISKEAHQALAMLHARAVRALYSRSAKQKARSDCLSHLRASLCAPVAAGERTEMQRQEQV